MIELNDGDPIRVRYWDGSEIVGRVHNPRRRGVGIYDFDVIIVELPKEASSDEPGPDDAA